MLDLIPHLLTAKVAMLAQLDVNGFLLGDTFLTALANFISSLIFQLFSVFLYGSTTVA